MANNSRITAINRQSFALLSATQVWRPVAVRPIQSSTGKTTSRSLPARPMLQAVYLPDRLHTLAEPELPARDLPELPRQPVTDQRPQHQLLSPPDTAGTSFVRRRSQRRSRLPYLRKPVPGRLPSSERRRTATAGHVDAEADQQRTRAPRGRVAARGTSRSSQW